MMVDSGRGTGDLLGGRYSLLEPIGYGGMSAVYRANDTALGREVAVKVFRSGLADHARQQSELAVLSQLEHHGLVGVLDAGAYRDDESRDHRFIVMPLVRGNTLRERLRGPRLRARSIAEIGHDLADALEYVHLNGVVHRDVKPSNVLLVDYGTDTDRMRAKLTDFGIALTEGVDRATLEGQTTGTVAYLSPEQAAGEPVGPPTDVYSLGLVLLQCFTRTLEFPGTPGESAVARLARDPVIPDYLPHRWQRLLSSMTARDPAARPTARELVLATRQIASAERGRHRHGHEDDALIEGVEGYAGKAGVLDTIPNEALHRVTAMAARLFRAPVSVVSVVDLDRTWLVSHYGEEVERIVQRVDVSRAEPPAEVPVVIEDALVDDRLKDHPLAAEPVGVRFYVGVPLRRADGTVIGTLSVADFKPGSASESDLANLGDLAALAVAQLELRTAGIRAATGSAAPGGPES